jgi:hypothetical protein
VCSRPDRPRRHRLGAADWLLVGVATDRAGLRQRCQLLTPPSRLERGRRLGEVADQAAELVRGRGGHRLVNGQRRFPQRAPRKGRADRTKPGRPRPDRLQVPLGGGSQRHPIRRPALGRQRPRCEAVAPVGPRHPADHRSVWKTGSASQASGQTPLRKSVRCLDDIGIDGIAD